MGPSLVSRRPRLSVCFVPNAGFRINLSTSLSDTKTPARIYAGGGFSFVTY